MALGPERIQMLEGPAAWPVMDQEQARGGQLDADVISVPPASRTTSHGGWHTSGLFLQRPAKNFDAQP